MKAVLTFNAKTTIFTFTGYDYRENLQGRLQCIPVLCNGRSLGVIPSIEVAPQYSTFEVVTALLDTFLAMMSLSIFPPLAAIPPFQLFRIVVPDNDQELKAAIIYHGFKEESRNGDFFFYERQLQNL
jgi:hypothetical protein